MNTVTQLVFYSLWINEYHPYPCTLLITKILHCDALFGVRPLASAVSNKYYLQQETEPSAAG